MGFKMLLIICFLNLLLVYQSNALNYIGVLPLLPMSNCVVGETALLSDVYSQYLAGSAQTFEGFEVNLLLEVANTLDWDLTQFKLQCIVSQSSLISTLTSSSNTNMLMTIGSNILSATALDYTNQTLPFYQAGLMAIVQTNSSISIWNFFKPFDVVVWILILLTLLFTGFVAWYFEDPTTFKKVNKQCCSNMFEMFYQSFSSFFFANDIRFQKLSTRLLFITFWFVTLITFTIYIACYTVRVHYQEPESPIKSISSLKSAKDTKILTFQFYENEGFISTSSFKGSFQFFDRNELGLEQMISKFQEDSGKTKVIIAEYAVAKYLSNLYPCSAYLIDEFISSSNLQWVFNSTINSTFINDVSIAIFQQKESQTFRQFQNQHINIAPIETTCDDQKTQILLKEIGGIWIIMIIAIAVAIIVDRVQYVLDKRKQLREEKISKSAMQKQDKPEQSNIHQDLNNLFLSMMDYVHIPSKQIHQKVETDIKKSIDSVDTMIKDRLNLLENKVLEALRKYPNKKTTLNRMDDVVIEQNNEAEQDKDSDDGIIFQELEFHKNNGNMNSDKVHLTDIKVQNKSNVQQRSVNSRNSKRSYELSNDNGIASNKVQLNMIEL